MTSSPGSSSAWKTRKRPWIPPVVTIRSSRRRDRDPIDVAAVFRRADRAAAARRSSAGSGCGSSSIARVHRPLHRLRRVEADVPLVEAKRILDAVHHVADADDAGEGHRIEELCPRFEYSAALIPGPACRICYHGAMPPPLRAGGSVEDFCRACKTDRHAHRRRRRCRRARRFASSAATATASTTTAADRGSARSRAWRAGAATSRRRAATPSKRRSRRDREPFPIVSERERIAPPMSEDQTWISR